MWVCSSAPLTAASGEQFKPGRLLSTPAVRATAPPSVSLGAMCLQALCAVQNFLTRTGLPCRNKA